MIVETSALRCTAGRFASALWLVVVFLAPRGNAHVPAELEARLHEIYEDRAFEVEKIGPVRWSIQDDSCTVLEPSAQGVGRALVRYEPRSGIREVLASAAQLTPVGASAPLEISDFALSPNGGAALLVANQRSDESGVKVADYWMVDRNGSSLKKLVSGAEQPRVMEAYSPDGSRILYARARNLYVQNVATGVPTQLTTDGVLGSVGNGSSDWAFGMAHWSPDGQWIAYLRTDASGVGRFPILDTTKAAYPTPRYIRFPMPGTPLAVQRLGVISTAGGMTRWIELPGEPGSYYLEGLRWGRNAHELIIQKLARSKNIRDTLLIDLRAGTVATVLHEEDPAWLDDVSEGYLFNGNRGFKWIRDVQAFTWLSERNGWRHVYIVSRDGRRQTLLTPGAADVISLAGVDEHSGWVYYTASPENATQRYLYRVSLNGEGRAERITPADEPGTHEYDFSPNARWAVHTYSTADKPPVIELIRLPQHRSVRVLGDNAALRARLSAWGPRPAEFLTLDAGNGVKLDAWMLKPRSFTSSQKYPVIVFVYGEPAVQTVIDAWSMGLGLNVLHRAFADAGYIVVSIDNRGTPAPRGAAWRRAEFGSLGVLATEDQAAGLRDLGRRVSSVDLSRVGIWGRSSGGSNVLNALFRKPEQYHVGIAIAPSPRHDLSNAWYQETFMRTPQDNAEGYQRSSPINFAEGLQGHLLIVHGTGDDNTHLQGTELLVNRLIELGKPFDYMPYPGRGHGIDEGPGTRLHLALLMARFLARHLHPAEAQPRDSAR